MIYKGILIRDNNDMDKWIVDEMDKDYKFLLDNVKDKYVMDIGANIGAFTTNALMRGAKHVIAVEPEPDNIKWFNLNTKPYDNVILYEGVVGPKDGKAELFVNEGTNKGLHSINTEALVAREKTYHKLEVNMYDLRKLLDKFQPEVLKIDIEGGELLLIDILTDLPDCVKYIAIEFDSISDKYIPILQYMAKNFKDAERNKFFTGSKL